MRGVWRAAIALVLAGAILLAGIGVGALSASLTGSPPGTGLAIPVHTLQRPQAELVDSRLATVLRLALRVPETP